MAKAGRPKTDYPREKQVSFFLTPDDAEYLDKLANGLGLRSRSILITAIMESLIVGGFSGVAFYKLWAVLDKRFAEHGYPQELDFRAIFRPPFVFPEPTMSREETEAFINKLKTEMKGRNNKKRDVSATRQS